MRIIGHLPAKEEFLRRNRLAKKSVITPAQIEKLQQLHHTPVVAGYGPLIWKGGHIRGCGNSAGQAVNLLGRLGVRRILLVGVDGTHGAHWHDRHSHPGAAHATADTARRWVNQWSIMAPDLKERGIEVINCSMKSAVSAFPKQPFLEALR